MRAARAKTINALAQVRMRFLDNGEPRETGRALTRDRGDCRIDRRDAEIGRNRRRVSVPCRNARRTGTRFVGDAETEDQAGHSTLWHQAVVQIRHYGHRAVTVECGRSAAKRWATRPMLGRIPTTPPKLAGFEQRGPTMSSTMGSNHAVPVRALPRLPPEEPAAERADTHGLRVRAEQLR